MTQQSLSLISLALNILGVLLVAYSSWRGIKVLFRTGALVLVPGLAIQVLGAWPGGISQIGVYAPWEWFVGEAYVHDGDTIYIGKHHLRLHAIAAPELDETCKRRGSDWSCGIDARDALRGYLKGKNVQCKWNGKFALSRFAVVCFAEGVDINDWLVRSGWAIASTRFGTEYVGAQTEAKRNCRKVWESNFVRFDQRKRDKLEKPEWITTECANK